MKNTLQSSNLGHDQILAHQADKPTQGRGLPFDAVKIPEISFPKGGGALKGIDEKFEINPSNGTASFTIPLPLSQNRNGFNPPFVLSYNSGSGNGIFGLGWSFSNNSIKRKTDKKIPRYRDAEEEDIFTFSDGEDLVPFLVERKTGEWEKALENKEDYLVERYRPRVASDFERIEKITSKNQKNRVYWKVTTSANITTFFGRNEQACIANPENHCQIFEWLPEFSYDDRGNWIMYEYKSENLDNVPCSIVESNRLNGNAPFANKYLKRIKYGNRKAYFNDKNKPYNPILPENLDYFFEIVLDYGAHDKNIPSPDETPGRLWAYRADAFSSYRSGFEIRTSRLCKRILLFHHFEELGEQPCLVQSLDCAYEPSSINGSGQAEVTYLKSVTQSGYIRKADGSYHKKSLPPIAFSYQRLKWNTQQQTISPENIMNAPVGLTNNYQWVDLYGEGLSGILTEQGDGWFYKENLGDTSEEGTIKFTRANRVIPKPSLSGLAKDFSEGNLALMDLENNGQKQIVVNIAGLQGYFELGQDKNWEAFRAFEGVANVDFQAPNTRFLDINGDGQPDLIITENQVFVWYLSDGKKGYTAEERTSKSFDEDIGPAVIFNDLEEKIFLADMTGDGLKDIVRARNGEICYWANMGYGRFSAKVGMGNAPWFDTPDLFNPEYLQFADVSGTGATDLIYFGQNHFKAYLNLSGNAWSDVHEIDPFFPINRNTKISVTDLLGNGTSSIVWSSDLPADRHAPMRYIDLMGKQKPHVLNGYKNNLGKEITLEYKSSSYFYLKDKQAGKPWLTKLAFPVQVVSKLTLEDKITQVRFTSNYSYHHGFYDRAEREFRGFGRVEQIDSEYYETWAENNEKHRQEASGALYQAPVLTKSWFHTGAFFEKERLLNQFEKEYWYNEFERTFPCCLDGFEEVQLTDASLVAAPTILDENSVENLCPAAWRQAAAACKGMMLRQEIFALDSLSQKAGPEQKQTVLKPYSVATHNCQIQLLQPQEKNKYAVFQVMESEHLQIQYERDEKNPRIAHHLNIAFDEFGNVLESATVVYPRNLPDETLPLSIRQEQQKTKITFTQNIFTNDVVRPEAYRLRLLAETKIFELINIKRENALFLLSDFDALRTNKTTEWPYGQSPAPDIAQHRKIGHYKTRYYNQQVDEALPFQSLAAHAIPFANYQLAYTPEMLTHTFGDKLSALEVLRAEGGYLDLDSNKNWWIPSQRVVYLAEGEEVSAAENRFLSPIAYLDAFGAKTKIDYYKDHFLMVRQTTDALENSHRVEQFNFRNLAPQLIRDLNDNLFTMLYDELGMVKAFAKLGKDLDGDGLAELDIADDLNGLEAVTEAEQADITAFFQSENSTDLITKARGLVINAGIRFVYDLEAYTREGKPVAVAKIRRATHTGNLTAGTKSKLQVSFEYSDGLGNVVMRKTQATPGKAKALDADGKLIEINTGKHLRWRGNGRTVLNNKGNPVKQYEPYFSTSHQYEADEALVEIGVTPILRYDALDRLIRTDFPDGTFSRVLFDTWKQIDFDQNDTVRDSEWYAQRIDSDSKKEWVTATRTALHHATPGEIHLDTLGRPILTIEHNRNNSGQDEFYHTLTQLDIRGNIQKIIDARGNTVMSYAYDLADNRSYQYSMDSGERWLLNNVVQKPMRRWDARNHSFEFSYDVLQRPLEMKVVGGDGEAGLNHVYEKIVYGENVEDDRKHNLRGQVYCHYDTAGLVTNVQYDDRGKIIKTSRRFAKDYKTILDWSGDNKLEKLEPEPFWTTYEYDALDRVIAHSTPDGSITRPAYNEANLLNHLSVLKPVGNIKSKETAEDTSLDTAGNEAIDIVEAKGDHPDSTQSDENNFNEEIIVRSIRYNEKEQRTKIKYGNGVSTVYQYDTETFRLKKLRSTGQENEVLQNLHYTYDPIGNITCIDDKAIPVRFFNNQKISAKNHYTYDALYRLIKAEGREHAGQNNFGPQDNWQDLAFLKSYSSGDRLAWRNYKQEYDYDPVGNILQMRHRAKAANWTRDYQYEANNNRLRQTQTGDQVYEYPHHEQHGFIQSMPHLQRMDWNFRDELQAVARQKVSEDHIPETTYYCYDAKGQRVRKVTETAAGNPEATRKKKERLYLGTLEIYQEHMGQHQGLQRNSLHIAEYFPPESKAEAAEPEDQEKPLTEEEQKFNPTLGIEDTIATITKRTEASLLTSLFHPSMVMGKRIALIDSRNEVNDNTGKETIRYQLGNHLDSVALELDGQGRVISYEEYHPYGTTAYQAIDTGIRAVAKRYKYTAKERDEETGLYYHGARYYIPWLGRWLKPDPGGVVDGVNGYVAFDCNPLKLIDHSGFAGKGGESEEIVNQNKGFVKVTAFARRFSRRSEDEKRNLEKLVQTANELSKRGFDVIVTGEGAPQDLLVSEAGENNFLPAESKTPEGKGTIGSIIAKAFRQKSGKTSKLVVVNATNIGGSKANFDKAIRKLGGQVKFDKPILFLHNNSKNGLARQNPLE